ncbi:MAG: TatD family hydrolase [Gammaproteobacteria bacterium]|nr:TatD family hydrolase [Gammaproteobacteria bacterium]
MIDSHCHLDFEVFDLNRRLVLQQCAVAGITDILIPGVAPVQWQKLAQLVAAETPLRLWMAAGLHPWWIATASMAVPAFARWLQVWLAQRPCVAIGECGLDGGIECPMDTQRDYFCVHLQMACDLGKPLIVHAHKAHNDVLRLLSQYRPPAGGVIHGFAGSLELARQYWRLGFYIGVGGTISYPRARKTRAALAAMPLESLLLETDAPDMPLCGMQGEPNSPLQLLKVADHLAVLQGLSRDRVQQQTDANARQLFGLHA